MKRYVGIELMNFHFVLLLTTSIFYYRVYHQILTLLKEALLGKFLKLILFKLSIDNSLILCIQIMKSNRGPNAFVCNRGDVPTNVITMRKAIQNYGKPQKSNQHITIWVQKHKKF